MNFAARAAIFYKGDRFPMQKTRNGKRTVTRLSFYKALRGRR